MGLSQWISGAFDRWLTDRGYVKADDVSGAAVVLSGETRDVPLIDFAEWTDEQKERLAITLSWVYSDVNLIAGEAAGAELGVYRREGEQTVEEVNHPFEQVMRRPFKFWPQSFTLRYTFMWWLLRGEAYWMKIENQAGELSGFIPVPSSRMRPIPHEKEYIAGFAYKPRHGKPAVPLPASEIVYFRFPNPFDFHRGLSPRTGYQLPMETDAAMQRWNRDTFNKEATLRTIITLPSELDPQIFKQAKETILHELMVEHKRFIVARAGQVDAKSLGLAHKELEYLAGREFSREEIDRVFGVPAGFWAKEATRANTEAAKATLIENTVWPLLVLAHDTITEQIVIPHYGEDLVARFADIRPRDRRMLIAERRQYWQVASFNEARDDLGQEEYAGPLADVIGALPVPLATNPQFVLTMAGLAVPLAGGGAQLMAASAKSAMRSDLRRWRSVARRLEKEEDRESAAAYDFTSAYIPAGVGAMVKAAIDRVGADEAFRFLKAVPPVRDEVEARLQRKVAAVFKKHKAAMGDAIEGDEEPDYEALASDLRAAIEPEIAGIATEEALRVASEVGILFDVAVINAEAAAWARTYTYDLISGLTDTTRKVVSNAIRQFIETEGMTRGELEKLLEPAFGKMRASMIGVTEVTRAYSAAAARYNNLLDASGVYMETIWHTNADALVCPICGPLNGKPESEWRDDFPDGPPAHPNCRCWVTLRYVGRAERLPSGEIGGVGRTPALVA